ncbi:MAG: hypothetical protein VYA34_05385 [Myxococcota bacterium]|nr:hypothetical protein [Myxococcota bacterium]
MASASRGMDSEASLDICDLIWNLADQGRTFFVSVHLQDMAEKLCDPVRGNFLFEPRSKGSLEPIVLKP